MARDGRAARAMTASLPPMIEENAVPCPRQRLWLASETSVEVRPVIEKYGEPDVLFSFGPAPEME